MRLALDASALVTPGTGVASFVSNLMDALAAMPGGPQVEPYTLSATAGLKRSAIGRWVPLPAGVVHRSWGRWSRPRIDTWLGGPDVIHGTNFVVPPSRLPRVATVHDLSFVEFPDETPLHVQRFDAILARAAKSGAWIHAPSDYVAEAVRLRYGSERVVTVYEGGPAVLTAEEVLSLSKPSDRRTILSLGSSAPRKRLTMLVRAFAELAVDRPDIDLAIVGPSGADEAALQLAIASVPAPVRSRIDRRGWVSNDERDRLMCSADVMAYPSVYEGFGLPVLEAMAHHLPVVAARATSIPEVAGDAAVLVQPDSLEDLVVGLSGVLDNEALAAGLVGKGIDRVAGLSWHETAVAMTNLYQRALGGR